ncbi:MAG: radical SAM protein [candidate division WOR-3 bacterium]
MTTNQKKNTTPFFWNPLINASVWAVRHRIVGLMVFNAFDFLVRRLILPKKRSAELPKKIVEDKYYMLRALLYSGLKESAPPKTLELLKNIFTLGYTQTKEEVPGFMVISPGKRCNLRCPDCYANSATEKDALDYEVLSRIVREAKETWHMRFFVISGGEPFIYQSHGKGIIDLAQENPDCLFLVYTNGLLINEAVAKRLGELGNITPAISVEGMKATTDRRRGAGTFDKILKVMSLLRQERVIFGISLTATRHNAYELLSDEFIDFFFNQQKARYAWLFHYMPIGRNPNPEMMPTVEERLWLYQRSWELIKKHKIMIADFWNHGTVSSGCIAAARPGGYFHIDWNGDVSPCVFFPFAVANINEIYKNNGHLQDILKTPLFEKIQEWQKSYGYQAPLTSRSDWLRPCPIRDHFLEALQLIKSSNPRPTDFSPLVMLSDNNFAQLMNSYNEALAEKTKPIWEGEYLR